MSNNGKKPGGFKKSNAKPGGRSRGASSKGKSYKSSNRGEKPFEKREDRRSSPRREGENFGGKRKFSDKDRPFKSGERKSRRFDDEKSFDRGEKKFEKREDRRSSPRREGEGFGGKRKFSDKDRPFKSGERKSRRFDDKKTFDRGERKPIRRRRDVNADSEILQEIVENRRKTGRLVDRPKILSLRYDEENGPIRLNKYIANAGICSRREADTLIETGAISVNGEVVTELGTKVLPTDEVRYGDQVLRREKPVYVLLNKPKDYITTLDDERDRKNVMELIQGACRERVYPVGRLDRNTTGLLLFTNDGDLAKKLMHPMHGIRKVYQVELDKNLKHDDLMKLTVGVDIGTEIVVADAAAYSNPDTKREVGIEIHTGQNRVVRRIFESMGYKVVKLDRTLYAGLTKKDLPRGRWRILTSKEVICLK